IEETGANFAVTYALIALVPVAALTAINIVGVRWGKWTQNGLTVVKVLGLVGVLVAGFLWAQSTGDEYRVFHGTVAATGPDSLALESDANSLRTFVLKPGTKVTLNGDEVAGTDLAKLQGKTVKVLARPDDPFRAVRIKATDRSPLGALTMALILVLWTYAGWHEGAYVAAEVRDKRRNLPRALLLSTAAVTVLYLLVNVAYIIGLGFETAADSKVVAADLLARIPGGFGETAMCLLVMLSSLGAINGMLCTNARIFAEFGNEHSLFAPLGWWNNRLRTLAVALMVQFAVCAGTIVVV